MEKKLVAFVTASLPEPQFTIDVIGTLRENGADAIELGVPFSDPVADGPIIELASQKSLAGGFKLQDIFDISKNVANDIPLYWMGYLNPFYHYGLEKSVQQAASLGVKGFIIPDMPFEEGLLCEKIFQENNVANICFVAPTDSASRIEKITQNSKEFIYMVAYTGITGSGQEEDLSRVIADVRKSSSTPLYLGFGVNAKTARHKAKDVDGVIVGSSFMEILVDEGLTKSQKIAKMGELARIIKSEITA
jgi:tryptophan synthase alpha chain